MFTRNFIATLTFAHKIDETPTTQSPRLRDTPYTPQEEIDFCLNCTEENCDGDCEKFRKWKKEFCRKKKLERGLKDGRL